MKEKFILWFLKIRKKILGEGNSVFLFFREGLHLLHPLANIDYIIQLNQLKIIKQSIRQSKISILSFFSLWNIKKEKLMLSFIYQLKDSQFILYFFKRYYKIKFRKRKLRHLNIYQRIIFILLFPYDNWIVSYLLVNFLTKKRNIFSSLLKNSNVHILLFDLTCLPLISSIFRRILTLKCYLKISFGWKPSLFYLYLN